MAVERYLLNAVKDQAAELKAISEGESVEYDCLEDFMADVLEMSHTFDQDGDYIGSRLVTALGGPKVEIDTARGLVIGYSMSGTADVPYEYPALDALAREYAMTAIENAR